MADRIIGQGYFDESDKDAMAFLNNHPKGTIIASDETNYFLPLWSGHYALYHPAESQYLGGGSDREEKKKDTALFFSKQVTQQEAQEILEKYDIEYVFYGSKETELGNTNIGSYPFLEEIYNSEAKVYKVIANP